VLPEKRGASFGEKPRRIQHQDSCECRWVGKSAGIENNWRRKERYYSRGRIDRGLQRKDTKVIGDKGYDADKLIEKIGEAQAVIPPKRNRKTQRHYDKHLYQERHLIECFFHKLKQYRHLFSRFDKLARNFLSFLYLVSALFWLK
jgi:transposase